MNPLFNAMRNPSMNDLKSILNASKNPMAIFQQLAQANPSLQPIYDELKAGKSPKDIALREMQKRGIDPSELFK